MWCDVSTVPPVDPVPSSGNLPPRSAHPAARSSGAAAFMGGSWQVTRSSHSRRKEQDRTAADV